MNPAPGFKKRPEYRIAVKPSGARVQVLLNGEVVADSKKTLVLHAIKELLAFYPSKVEIKAD